jgi:flagellar basal-body rod protein FlgF
MDVFRVVGNAMKNYSNMMDNVASNLANINTTGYKKNEIAFKVEDAMPVPFSYSILKQGELYKTDSMYDISLEGNGFFELDGEEKKIYSRGGKIEVNENGELVDSNGNYYTGENGKIKVDKDLEFTIKQNGEIVQNSKVIDKFKIFNLKEKNNIIRYNNSSFLYEGSKEEAEPKVYQGFIENSNVNLVEEMSSIIRISRNFGSFEKMISMDNDITNKMIDDLGKF